MSDFKNFRVIRREKAKKPALWKRVPDEVWEGIGETAIKVVGHHLKSKVVKFIIIGIIAAATKAVSSDEGE